MPWVALATSLIFVAGGTFLTAAGERFGAVALLFGGAGLTTALAFLNPALAHPNAGSAALLLARFPGPVRLSVPRAKQMLFLVSATLWASALLLVVLDDPPDGLNVLFVWPAAILFAAAVPFAALALLRGSTLELTIDGFRLRRGLQRHEVRWADASGFHALHLPHAGQPTVLYDNAAIASTAARLNRRVAGGSSGLPETYGLPAEELAGLMTDWREKALGRRGASGRISR